MFAKLLKHEFFSVRKILTGLCIAAIIAGLLGGLIMWNMTQQLNGAELDSEKTAMLTIISMLVFMGIYVSLFAFLISSFIILYLRFYRSKFTDEGYLTFTLPATTHQILLSSILNQLIWGTIIYIVFLISAALMFLPMFLLIGQEANLALLFQELGEIYSLMGFNANTLAAQIFTWISGIAYGLILPIASITIGSLVAKKHKILASIGIGYGINMALSFLTGILTVTTTFIDIIFSNGNPVSLFNEIMLIPSLIQLVIAIAGYFVTHYLIEKHLNLP